MSTNTIARTLSTNPGTVASRKRSNAKGNTGARLRARVAIAAGEGRCIYCALTVCQSRFEHDGTLPLNSAGLPMPRQDAWALELCHIVSESKGGTFKPGQIGPGHRECNRLAGDIDSTPFVITEYVPTEWPTATNARNGADPRDIPPMTADDAPTVEAMRAARARRGLPF